MEKKLDGHYQTLPSYDETITAELTAKNLGLVSAGYYEPELCDMVEYKCSADCLVYSCAWSS